MDELRVGFAALAEAEQNMRNTVRRVDALLEDLSAYLKPMMATWTGEAAAAYQLRQAEWDDAVADQLVQLGRLHELVINAHQNHADAVRTNKKIWAV